MIAVKWKGTKKWKETLSQTYWEKEGKSFKWISDKEEFCPRHSSEFFSVCVRQVSENKMICPDRSVKETCCPRQRDFLLQMGFRLFFYKRRKKTWFWFYGFPTFNLLETTTPKPIVDICCPKMNSNWRIWFKSLTLWLTKYNLEKGNSVAKSRSDMFV